MAKLKIFCLSIFLLVRSLSASDVFSYANDFSFYTFDKVLKAYEGKWTGSTTISTPTDILASFDSDNTYMLLGSGADMKIIGTGTINSKGTLIYISSTMHIEDGKLILILNSKGNARYYEGIVSAGKVSWYNLRKIYHLETLTDYFSDTAVGVQIQSEGIQPLNIPSRNIFTYVKSASTFIKKNKEIKQDIKENALPDNIDLSKIKL